MTGGRGLGRGVSALSRRNYRLFFFGQLISLIGTWMQSVAQSWLVLTLTHDPVALGITVACQFVPVMVLGLFGGVIADALPKRETLYVTQASAGLLALVLGLLVAGGQIQVWQIYLIALTLGVVNAVDMPVRQSFVVEMVGREHIANAVALNSAVYNAARIVGPAIAGILIGILTVAPCFFINAASYVAVIAALFSMRSEELQPAPRLTVSRDVRSVAAQLAEGLGYVWRTPIVLVPIVVLGIVATVGMNYSVILPLYASETLHGGADTYGYLMAAGGIGSVLSAISIAFGTRPSMRLLFVGAALVGCSLIALAFSSSLILSLPIMLVLGWAAIALSATTNTLIQLNVPDQLRGRVMSVYTTVFAGSSPIGGMGSGLFAAAAGVPATLLLAGGIAAGTALIAAWRAPRQGARAQASREAA